MSCQPPEADNVLNSVQSVAHVAYICRHLPAGCGTVAAPRCKKGQPFRPDRRGRVLTLANQRTTGISAAESAGAVCPAQCIQVGSTNSTPVCGRGIVKPSQVPQHCIGVAAPRTCLAVGPASRQRRFDVHLTSARMPPSHARRRRPSAHAARQRPVLAAHSSRHDHVRSAQSDTSDRCRRREVLRMHARRAVRQTTFRAVRKADARDSVRPFAILLANEMCEDHPVFRVARAKRPETGFARKAGDCFGFSPSFAEWILVLADGGRFRIDPSASAHRRSQPGHGAGRSRRNAQARLPAAQRRDLAGRQARARRARADRDGRPRQHLRRDSPPSATRSR